MTGWTSNDAQIATHGTLSGAAWQAESVGIDSRAVKAGELFVAIAGERFDGHDYVAQALEKGAAAAMVSKAPVGVAADAPLITVADTLEGLRGLAAAARARSHAKIAGVTGSVGKTSAKEMLRCALAAQGGVFSSRGNFNNHIGMPLNLANLPQASDFAIFEMGMNHAGEITPLSTLARPHAALITTVEAVHLEFFDSVEAIADAKAEIFDGLEAGGIAVLPLDNPHYARLEMRAAAKGLRVVRFGETQEAEFQLLGWKIDGLGATYTLNIRGTKTLVAMKAIGKHWGLVAAGVLAMVEALGGSIAKAVAALAEFGEVEGRGTLHEMKIGGASVLLIDDSYNASPASMKAAIEKLAMVHAARGGKGRSIAALGDMLELGSETASLHAGLADVLKAQKIDHVFAAGALMRSLAEALPAAMCTHAGDAASALPRITEFLKEGDTLLIKGSHGSKMHQLATTLKQETATPKEVAHAV